MRKSAARDLAGPLSVSKGGPSSAAADAEREAYETRKKTLMAKLSQVKP